MWSLPRGAQRTCLCRALFLKCVYKAFPRGLPKHIFFSQFRDWAFSKASRINVSASPQPGDCPPGTEDSRARKLFFINSCTRKLHHDVHEATEDIQHAQSSWLCFLPWKSQQQTKSKWEVLPTLYTQWKRNLSLDITRRVFWSHSKFLFATWEMAFPKNKTVPKR